MTLSLHAVSKRYGDTMGLQNLTLHLPQGVIAVLGANGSGKSTLLRLLATLIAPDEGEIRWQGLSYQHHKDRIRQYIGYVPQDIQLPDDMRVQSLFKYLAQMRDVTYTRDVLPIIERLTIKQLLNRRIRDLSGGEMRLVAFAQALIGTPKIVLIDEIFKGLSVEERQLVQRTISAYAYDKTIIVSTHLPDEVDAIANDIVVLRDHQLVIHQPIDAFKHIVQGQVHTVQINRSQLASLQAMYRVLHVVAQDDTLICRVLGDYPPDLDAVPQTPTLMDSYLMVYGTGMKVNTLIQTIQDDRQN